MNREKILPARMNALWFTYVAIFMFSLLPGFGYTPSLVQILSVSASWVVIVNLYAFYQEKPIMDERKQRLATEAMAWAFVAIALITIVSGSTETAITEELLRNTAEMGLWTWLMAFSFKNLYQRYGAGLTE